MRVPILMVFLWASFGTFVQAQSNCTNMSNAERGGCLRNYGNFLETEMVAAYKEINRNLGNIVQNYGSAGKNLAESLQPSQAAFERYRNNQCTFDANLALQGNGGDIFFALCMNEMTSQRIKYLRQTANQLGDL